MLKKGDLVKIRHHLQRTKWTRHVNGGKFGILIKRTYLAYEEVNGKWEVLVDGSVNEYRAANIFKENENESRNNLDI